MCLLYCFDILEIYRGSQSYIQFYTVILHTYVGHCDDVAEVIRRKLNSIDHKAKGPIDAFALIYQSGLARRLSWQAQVEEAVKDESDEFWQQVHSYLPYTGNFGGVKFIKIFPSKIFPCRQNFI